MAFHSTGSQCSLSMGPWLSSMWLPILLRAKGFIIGMSKTNVPKRARKEADRFLWLSHGNQLTKFPYYSIHLSKQDLSKFEEWENKPYLLMGKVGKSCCKWTCIVCHFYYHMLQYNLACSALCPQYFHFFMCKIRLSSPNPQMPHLIMAWSSKFSLL